MSPEGGGLRGFVRRLAHIFRRRQELPPVPPEQLGIPADSNDRSLHQNHRRNEPPNAVQEIAEMQMRIIEGHPARRIVGNNFLSEDAFANEQVRYLIADLALTMDPRNYQHEEWLRQQRNRVASLIASVPDPDKDKLRQWQANLDQMLRRHVDADQRILDQRTQIQEVRRGTSTEATQAREALDEAIQELTSDPDIQAEADNIGELTAFKENWLDSAHTPPDPQHPENDPMGVYDERGKLANGQAIAYEKMFIKIREKMEAYVKSRNQDDLRQDPRQLQIFQEKYEKFDKALGSLSRLYITQHHDGRGSFSEEIGRRGSENMQEALQNDEALRDYWFYRILAPILTNERRESHRDLYNLYTSNDMERFMTMIGSAKLPNGEDVGKKLVGYYTMLKNTIFQTHDMDYYAAHPAQDIKEFMQSTSFFTNTYIDFATQDPMVAVAKRMYEIALLQIREDHGGYIPRHYLEWNPATREIELDRRVSQLVRQAIRNKQVYTQVFDPVTQSPAVDRWIRIQQGSQDAIERGMRTRVFTEDDLYGGTNQVSQEWRRQLGDLRIAAALKQAKGLALVDMRLLEIIGRSKGAGSNMNKKKDQDNYSFGGPGFNSAPYEGIVRHIEPIIHYYTRFRIGARKHEAFFNMLISEGKEWNRWSPENLKEIIEWHMSGDPEDKKKIRERYGEDLASRLNAADNPFGFSGMWGTMTKWRTGDATVDWDDWERERYSTANKLSFVGDRFIRQDHHGHVNHGSTWQVGGRAEAKVNEYFLIYDNHLRGSDGRTALQYHDFLKERARARMRSSGEVSAMQIADDPRRFESYWRKTGLDQIDESGKSYRQLLQEHQKQISGSIHDFDHHHKDHLTMQLERAYKARIWIQAAMRSPLIIARELRTSKPYSVAGHERSDVPLRQQIIYEILGIDLEQLKNQREPTIEEKSITAPILELEGAIATIQQKAIRENRDLRESDFEDIDDVQIREKAKRYWTRVREAVLGRNSNGTIREASQWYEKLGIEDADRDAPEGLRNHRINWHHIHGIDTDMHNRGLEHSLFEGDSRGEWRTELLHGRTIDRDWRYLFSTEDMGWEYLNITALGERNPVRRAGDLMAHAQFNSGIDELLGPGGALGPHFNKEKLVEHFQKMWLAISGDDADVAYDAIGRLLYTSAMMYRKADWTWKVPGIGQSLALLAPHGTSVMHRLYGGAMHADGVGPNEMLQFVHMAESADIIIPGPENPFTGEKDYWTEWNAHSLEQRLGGTVPNALYELATMGLLLAIALTIYRGLTAPSEEEGGGGGGHGGH